MVGPIKVDKKTIQHDEALEFHPVVFFVTSINQFLKKPPGK